MEASIWSAAVAQRVAQWENLLVRVTVRACGKRIPSVLESLKDNMIAMQRWSAGARCHASAQTETFAVVLQQPRRR